MISDSLACLPNGRARAFTQALFASIPTWGHSRSWGYGPSGGLGLILVILVVLVLTGRL